MTSSDDSPPTFRVERLRFTPSHIRAWGDADPLHKNWPVVYALDDSREIYVGESINVAARLGQHLENPAKRNLTVARVVIDETFNKSVCLDLESFLIRLLSGDRKYRVLNGNAGVTDAQYYQRDRYRQTFEEIFEQLLSEGVFTQSIPSIENSDLFKLSPFKALQPDQERVVLDIVEGLIDDIDADERSTIVIQGDPGTGKTVVAIYLMKLLCDIASGDRIEQSESDSVFADFFTAGHRESLEGLKVGLVVPQAGLRTTIKRVFAKTPSLRPSMVLSPFEVGASREQWDLLIVDETHRLNQRAAQAAGPNNRRFSEITSALFGDDDVTKTQLDWVVAQSKHQIFLADPAQSVRPADLQRGYLEALSRAARDRSRHYRLMTQMRVRAGDDYVGYVRDVLSAHPPQPRRFERYDLRFFDDLDAMRSAIFARDAETGLARVVAGYAWKWRSQRNPDEVDIEIDGLRLQWNRVLADWVTSPGSLEQVGSIHTVQGYDLNYAGVIIGPDLRYDPASGRLVFDRSRYFDKRGVMNNKALGITYADDDILEYVRNIYGVLLTRGMLGTYVYVCDAPLRERLRPFFPPA